MLVEKLFHFRWIDVLSASNDCVLHTSADYHVTVVVHRRNVSVDITAVSQQNILFTPAVVYCQREDKLG